MQSKRRSPKPQSRSAPVDAFVRPWFEETVGKPPLKRRHPYPRDLFREREIFPLLVLDGGAFFWLNDRMGGTADGKAVLDGLESGKLLEPWRAEGKPSGELDWELPLRRHGSSSLRTPLEERVWVHRLYFLLPIAQEFFRTGNEAWARKWMQYFREWADRHPRAADESVLRDDFVWFDMQVCWRLLVLIHSVYLLSGSSKLTRKDWGLIYGAIREHAHHALAEAKSEIARGAQGANHSLQRGTALLYAGVLFPEIELASECVDAGRIILTWQMREQVLPDGGSVEGSPSYSHFIARYYAEAWALLSKNRMAPIEGLETTIQRQYEWLFQSSSPGSLSLQIGDSYALDARADLQTAARLFPLSIAGSKGSTIFRDSQFAVLRNARFDLYVDAMKMREDHQHVGRPNLLVFANGEPLLVDSGCCNYDWMIQEHYLRGAWAHNVVLVPALQEPTLDVYVHNAELRQRYSDIAITEFVTGDRQSSVAVTSTVRRGNRGYTWERRIVLEPDRVRILDRVTSEEEVECRQLFHLARTNVALEQGGRVAVMRHAGQDARLEHMEPARTFTLSYQPAVDQRNAISISPTLVSEARGKECRFEVLLTLGSSSR